MLPYPQLPRFQLPLFTAVAGAAALGAVALYRRLTRETAHAVVRSNHAGEAPRQTVVVIESDGPDREPLRCEVPW